MLSTILSSKYFEDRYLAYVGSFALPHQLIAVVYTSSDPTKITDSTNDEITKKNLKSLRILIVIEDFSSGFSLDSGDVTVRVRNGKFKYEEIGIPFWCRKMKTDIDTRLTVFIERFKVKIS